MWRRNETPRSIGERTIGVTQQELLGQVARLSLAPRARERIDAQQRGLGFQRRAAQLVRIGSEELERSSSVTGAQRTASSLQELELSGEGGG